jgi:hypothetical protein
LQLTIGIYEVPTDGADAGAKAKGFQRSSCENLWVRGNLSGHFVNLMFAAGDLYKVHCPINLQVNPDRSRLYAGGQCCSVQPGLLKPNRITKTQVTNIDAAKQVEPDMLPGYALKMKDASRLAHLHKAACWLW